MLIITKLSEEVLGSVLEYTYLGATIKGQRRIKVLDKTMIIDYEVKCEGQVLYFEFDGPTHYTSSATQVRDRLLAEYCDIEGIQLVRIPYFIQVNYCTQGYLLPLSTGEVFSEYTPGFHDPKIVYPGNYNSYGWTLFIEQLESYDSNTKQRIIDSLVSNKDLELTLGIDYKQGKLQQLSSQTV
jgi:hypothetical protein